MHVDENYSSYTLDYASLEFLLAIPKHISDGLLTMHNPPQFIF